jgi:mannose-6-phosphate isomerase-like protein (cupin superfamily)
VGPDRAIVVRAGEGRSIALGQGLELCFKLDDAESRGRYSVSVATVAAGDRGTTPHVHREHDELFFVIEGAPEFRIEEESFEAPAGTFVLVPRGNAHRWWNPGAQAAVVLNIHAPGFGFESFIRELAELSTAGRATPAAMDELGARHDAHFDRETLDDRYAG